MTRTYRTTVLLALAAILSVSAQLPAAQVPRATLLAVRGLVKTRPAGGNWHQATLPQDRYLWPRDELQTHQHARARVRRPQLAASVRAPQIAQKIQTDAFRHMILAT